MDWIDLDHSLLEWLLFLAVIAILIAIKLVARKHRRAIAEEDAARRHAEKESRESDPPPD